MRSQLGISFRRFSWSQVSRFAPIAMILVALVLPIYSNDYWINVGTSILTYAMLGLGLNIVVGFAGLLDLGYAAFFAIGAYTSGLLTTKAGFNLWETLPFAMAIAAAAGAVIGYPTLRLRSDYLAIVTLGFGEIVRITATNLNFTGGPNGIWGIPKPSFMGIRLSDNTSLFYLALILLVITLIFTYTLTRSRLGRAWLSLREDESAAEAVGIPAIRVKLLAYVFGATWAGLAGAFFASRIGAINPQSFTYMQSILILMVVVLGGMASSPGVLTGAAVVVGLPELLRNFQNWRLFIFAVGLVVLMLIRPQGLWPAPRKFNDPYSGMDAHDLEQWDTTSEDMARKGDETIVPPPQGNLESPILEVSHLECRFGGIRAVADVSFQIPAGGIVSIIGPNGAGKTTIFNCITGVTRFQSGGVILDGHPLKGQSPHQVVACGMARTFQGIRLFNGMAVYDNVLVGMYPRQMTRVWQSLFLSPKHRHEERESLKKAYRLLAFCGVVSQAGSLASELSYGDQRRLEIARALASQPKVLLLDEPAAGMNPTEKRQLMSLIRGIRNLGITVVLIEHDMNFVMNISDRVIVMDRGEKIADDVPSVVQRDPRVIEAYLGQDHLEEGDMSVVGQEG